MRDAPALENEQMGSSPVDGVLCSSLRVGVSSSRALVEAPADPPRAEVAVPKVSSSRIELAAAAATPPPAAARCQLPSWRHVGSSLSWEPKLPARWGGTTLDLISLDDAKKTRCG